MARGCSSCGASRPRGATFCGRCGARLVTPRRDDAGAGVGAGGAAVPRLRVRSLPTAVAVTAAVVLAIGLRAEPVAGPVRAPEARGAADASAEVERLPVLRACLDAPPPCSSPSTEPTPAVASLLSLRLEQHRLTRIAEDGRDTWSLGLTGPADTAPGPADGIVVAERGGRLRLVDAASGAVRWERRLAVATGWDLAVAGDERSIAVLATPPTDGAPRVVRVMGISPRDGEVAWMHLANTRAPRPTTAVAGDVVVLSGVLGEAVVSALDRSTGLLRWQVDLGGPVDVLADGRRVAAVTDERLVVIEPDSGRRLLDVRSVGRITGVLAVSATGLVIDTEDGPVTVALPDT
jgi:hypothetical protein